MPASNRKYLSTTEMVSGFRKKTKAPIPHMTVPGDFRVYRPTKNDVLCGRGKPIQDHPGNLRMRRIVAKFTDRYMKARKHDKQEIVEDVVEFVKNSGGVLSRFLKRVGRENYWVEVPRSVACDKVSHALRCLVRKVEAGEPFDVLEDSSETSIATEDSLTRDQGDLSSSASSAPVAPTAPSAPVNQPYEKTILSTLLKSNALRDSPTSLQTLLAQNALRSQKSSPAHASSLVGLLLQEKISQAIAEQRKQEEEAQKTALIHALMEEEKRQKQQYEATKMTLAYLAVAAAGSSHLL